MMAITLAKTKASLRLVVMEMAKLWQIMMMTIIESLDLILIVFAIITITTMMWLSVIIDGRSTTTTNVVAVFVNIPMNP